MNTNLKDMYEEAYKAYREAFEAYYASEEAAYDKARKEENL